MEQPEQSSLRRKFVEEHGGRFDDFAVYGQESNLAMRRLAMMKLPLRGIECDLDPVYAFTLKLATKTNRKGLGYG